ncbi:LAMI_0F09670g1_1 [Lachancea mirantina]|uniref:LAMI_0F09670g1_1 n=1 Tax=Lachancea mirantina TaxID=1230905 RepID=A0A1G4K1B8_9SACH|nr:LAMI_0F09670g1_1 [Lachancea mirantina]
MTELVLPTANGLSWVHETSENLEAPNSRQILRIALNLKYLIDEVVPILFKESEITSDQSRILNRKVLKLTREACGGNQKDERSMRKYQSVVIFCLLKVCGWYWELASSELHNAQIYSLRATAAQQLCKLIIEEEEARDPHFLFIHMLCRRYVINENDEDQEAEGVLELALDMHSTIVIGSSGYQRCLKWLWRGWIVQEEGDASTFVLCDSVPSSQFSRHFHPDRLKTPMYQNIIQVFFSICYLVLYTVVVNSKNSREVDPIDAAEVVFYFFTVGSILDEMNKIYNVGWNYVGFWNAFNDSMYLTIAASMILRIVSVSPIQTHMSSEYWDKVSYRILSCAAPLVWCRLLLYLESERFIGALLVILKHMMKESIVFFFLLLLIIVGFLQGFLGLDSADGKRDITWPIVKHLFLTVLGFGGFAIFDKFAYPYAALLYYIYCFVVSVILLNILIALYSTAYEKVIVNALDEYMALMAQKTMRYIRAPDEDVYVPPFNIIEIIITPLMHLMPKNTAKEFSNTVMTIIYFPMLLFIALKEIREAKRVSYNRLKKLEDDANETDVAWDLTDGYVDEEDGWLPNNELTGIAATQKKNKNSLKLQREAENSDPHFKVDKKWFKNVRDSVQPVSDGFHSGLGWENYGIFSEVKEGNKRAQKKIDELSEMVEKLTKLLEKSHISN